MLTHLLSAHLTKLGSLAILLATWNKHLEEYGLGFVFVPCSCLERGKLSHSVKSDPLQPMDCSPPGSSVHGILQARTLEWVAISSSRELPDPGIKLASLACLALAGGFFTTESPGKPYFIYIHTHTYKCCIWFSNLNYANSSLFYSLRTCL